MVLVHLHPFEQLVDEHSPFGLGGFTPDCVDVEIGEVAGDRREPFGNLRSALLLLCLGLLGRSKSLDLRREPALLLIELRAVDPAVVSRC